LTKQINDNLSQQIQLIYDNLADGLTGDPVNLSSIIDVRDGTHDSPKAVDDGFPLVTSKHLLPYGVDLSTANLISKEDFDKTNERSIVETHDILISMIGTVGLISLVIDDPVPFAIKNVGLFKTSKCPDLYAYILTYLRSTKTTQHIEKTLAGSTQKYISLGELRKMPIILPDKNQLSDFNSIVVPLIMQITNLTEENKRLAELRNTLLPKLISGELDISDINL
jgi:type I restriction enzyme S subunit